jgi:hypothetical protein
MHNQMSFKWFVAWEHEVDLNFKEGFVKKTSSSYFPMGPSKGQSAFLVILTLQ